MAPGPPHPHGGLCRGDPGCAAAVTSGGRRSGPRRRGPQRGPTARPRGADGPLGLRRGDGRRRPGWHTGRPSPGPCPRPRPRPRAPGSPGRRRPEPVPPRGVGEPPARGGSRRRGGRRRRPSEARGPCPVAGWWNGPPPLVAGRRGRVRGDGAGPPGAGAGWAGSGRARARRAVPRRAGREGRKPDEGRGPGGSGAGGWVDRQGPWRNLLAIRAVGRSTRAGLAGRRLAVQSMDENPSVVHLSLCARRLGHGRAPVPNPATGVGGRRSTPGPVRRNRAPGHLAPRGPGRRCRPVPGNGVARWLPVGPGPRPSTARRVGAQEETGGPARNGAGERM